MTAATGSMPVGHRLPRIAAGQILVASISAALSLAVVLGGGPASLTGRRSACSADRAQRKGRKSP